MTTFFKNLVMTTLLIGSLFGAAFSVSAESKGPRLILDAELEDYLLNMATPMLKTLGKNRDDVRIHVIADDTVNAFVVSQQDMFFHTGLIIAAESPDEVRGVMAHELGHIHGKHLVRLRNAMSQTTVPTIIGGVLGLGAAMAGAADAATALLVGGLAAGQSALLQFSRSQEQQADQIAVRLLNENNYTTTGLRDFFGRLKTNEVLYHDVPPPYLMTHPRSTDREAFLAQMTADSGGKVADDAEQQAFQRIRAKAFAMTNSPGRTLRTYGQNSTPAGDYARLWAYALQGRLAEAKTLLEKLQNVWGENDVFLRELEGLIAVDESRLNDALTHFKAAFDQRPDISILHYEYALTLQQAGKSDDAIREFEKLRVMDLGWPGVHYQLGILYGQKQQLALSHTELAEAAYLRGNLVDAEFHLKVAASKLGEDDTRLKMRQAALSQSIDTAKRQSR